MTKIGSSSIFNMNNKSRGESKPAHWPQHLEYINDSCFHSSVSPSTRFYLSGSSSGGINRSSNAKWPRVVIRAISNPVHPACGQFGLFAAQRISPRSNIIKYIEGQIHCDERLESDYDLSLYRFPNGLSVGIDASIMGNEARFVNDYRGITKKPNAIFVDERNESGDLQMIIRSVAEIDKGEEILVSYGKSWWKNRTKVHDEFTFNQNLT